MNNTRRRAIRNVIKLLRGPSPDFDYIESELSDILDEETDAIENIPENLQETERYQIAEDSIDYLDEAINAIDPDDEGCAEEIIKILEQIDGV